MFCYLYLALTEISIYRYRVENIAKTKLTRAQNSSKCDSLTKRQNSASLHAIHMSATRESSALASDYATEYQPITDHEALQSDA